MSSSELSVMFAFFRSLRRPPELRERRGNLPITIGRGRNRAVKAGHMLQVRRHRTDGEVEVTTVHLEATRAYFGGRRLWFRCPRCDGRCRVLYGIRWIACRRCHRLRYPCQRETKEDQATRQMLKIVSGDRRGPGPRCVKVSEGLSTALCAA